MPIGFAAERSAARSASDARFSDNFFDVLPGEKVELLVEAPGLTAADVRKRLRVHSLADAFPPSSVAAK
jgi:hypothetical protein